MPKNKAMIVMLVCMAIVYFERSLPWLLFGKKGMPKALKVLADLLPAALMATLVVYGLKDLPTSDMSTAAALIVASVFTGCIHYWKKNTILSVFTGTIVYVVLLNVIL